MSTAKSSADPALYRIAIQQTKDYALFLLDASGCVMTWNAGAERIKGYTSDEIIGRHFSTFYTRDSIESGWPAYELKSAEIEGRFEDEGWRVRKDGSRFWASVVITALRGDKGKLLGFSKITRDLTARKQQEEALRQSEERFRLLVEGVTDYSVYMLDLEGRITSWNIGAQRISGYAREDVIGRHFSLFYPAEDTAAGKPWEELDRARQTGRAEDEGWRLKKSGDRFWARVVVNALHDNAGHLRGFAAITQDLSERRHLANLEKATGNLNEFLALLAHELRNPLAPIRTAVQVMATTPCANPVHEAMRLTIDRQAVQLQRIVDDMLDVSRMTRGKLEINHETVDLVDIIRRANETAAPAVAAGQHQVTTELPHRPLLVCGDVHRLTQLVTNLLINAAHYSPNGGRIKIKVSSRANEAFIQVRDSGRGIEPENLERIFELFMQAHSPLKRFGEGLGVGLALARNIAELHGGTLVAHSAGANKGSEFTLRLPLLATSKPNEGVAPQPMTASEGVHPRRILIVDDNVDAAISLRELLTSLGHEATAVHDGDEALRVAPEFRPDIVLLDIGMPGLDGYEVAQRLRDLGKGAALQIIAVTGWGQPRDRERSREAGFDLHLVKPVDQTELTRILTAQGATLH